MSHLLKRWHHCTQVLFAVAPDRIPVDMFIFQAEKLCDMYKQEEVNEKQQLRADVRGEFKSTKPSKSYITKEENSALKDLHKNKSILILPADKERATVVMDKEECKVKMKDMLEDE